MAPLAADMPSNLRPSARSLLATLALKYERDSRCRPQFRSFPFSHPIRLMRRPAFVFAGFLAFVASHAGAAAPDPNAPVSYWKSIRPIFQAQCQGCHQPAKAKGGYVMTEYEKLLAAGDSKEAPIVPGKPDGSLLVKQIVPKNGEAEMPKGKPPLHAIEINLIKAWIAEGAKDDTPANARQRYDTEHLPVYTHAPIVTSLDYSPDGKLIAVGDRKSTRLNSSHIPLSRMPSSA